MMPSISDKLAKWLSIGAAVLSLVVSLAVGSGVIFVMRDDIQDNAEAIKELKGATAFAERITVLETLVAAHAREIDNQGAYGWRLENLSDRLGRVEQKTADQVRDDWVSWRADNDRRVTVIESQLRQLRDTMP